VRWLERAEYDLDTAEAMVTTARYIYAVFMCQQAVEKSFKALLASQGREVPPIHNLRRLAEASGTVRALDQEDLKKLDFLSQYYLNARYKEDIQELSRQVGEDMARQFVDFAREKM
jgi:HEPN domain-containing protein